MNNTACVFRIYRCASEKKNMSNKRNQRSIKIACKTKGKRLPAILNLNNHGTSSNTYIRHPALNLVPPFWTSSSSSRTRLEQKNKNGISTWEVCAASSITAATRANRPSSSTRQFQQRLHQLSYSIGSLRDGRNATQNILWAQCHSQQSIQSNNQTRGCGVWNVLCVVCMVAIRERVYQVHKPGAPSNRSQSNMKNAIHKVTIYYNLANINVWRVIKFISTRSFCRKRFLLLLGWMSVEETLAGRPQLTLHCSLCFMELSFDNIRVSSTSTKPAAFVLVRCGIWSQPLALVCVAVCLLFSQPGRMPMPWPGTQLTIIMAIASAGLLLEWNRNC